IDSAHHLDVTRFFTRSPWADIRLNFQLYSDPVTIGLAWGSWGAEFALRDDLRWWSQVLLCLRVSDVYGRARDMHLIDLKLLTLAGAYMAFLFAVAWLSERNRGTRRPHSRALVYGLSLAVYCTSWTYFGAVGTAARSGWDYLPIYIGPSLVLTLLFPLWRRIAVAAKRENAGSIADFLAARYGKRPLVGMVVAAVAILGALPYIALQLRSITMAVKLLGGSVSATGAVTTFAFAAALAGFAMLFGARRVGLTEHNPGLVRAIAVESIVKLTALISAGVFAVLVLRAMPDGLHLVAPLSQPKLPSVAFLTQILLSAAVFICLPRQFYMGFVELEDPRDMGWARWMLPLYLLLTCIAVVPIATAGLRLAGGSSYNPDLYVLALPHAAGAHLLTDFVFIGGFSAATAMVVVETVALSVMASNQFILPWLTRNRLAKGGSEDLKPLIIGARRWSIVLILLVASLCALSFARREALASIGLLCFVATAQLAPALLGAVAWQRAHSMGALAGILCGFGVWLVLLALPALLGPGDGFSVAVAAGFRHELGLDPLTGGALLSLGLNTLVFIGVSWLTKPGAVDRAQARAFVEKVSVDAEGWAVRDEAVIRLQAVIARFVGEDAARQALARARMDGGGDRLGEDGADDNLPGAAERLLAGVIGAAAARGVVAGTLAGGALRPRDMMQVLDNAAQAVQFNRELLHDTLDNLSQGVFVVDHDLRLIVWNRRFVEMCELPADYLYVGRPLADVVRRNALRGEYGPGDVEVIVEDWLSRIRRRSLHVYERQRPDGTIIRSNGTPMPNGGYLTSYTDITELRNALTRLAVTNEQLETRVVERTKALEAAKAQAELATLSKTRFLAAASHDLLQPLHAARLFLAALETAVNSEEDLRELVANADRSIDSAHKLLHALLNLSKLEVGGVQPHLTDFAVSDLFGQLEHEFLPQAQAKGLGLRFCKTGAALHSDYNLVRSMLQNLVGNAIRYTQKGGVLVGVRPGRKGWMLEVWDTGPGIPDENREAVFAEFTRLSPNRSEDGGVGLGLAIVRKVAHTLGTEVSLRSRPRGGCVFSVEIARADPITVEQSRPVVRTAAVRKGLRILCVDNEPAVLRGLRAVLERLGAEVFTARDAEEALALEGYFDLALVDYHLDQGDGLSLQQQLSSQVARFVIVTADSSEEVTRRASAEGVELVRKPIRPEILHALLAVG
ncbi:MAG: hybrid sensor histidine kinase/response regulator, partial [Rhizomicrobium sp.]